MSHLVQYWHSFHHMPTGVLSSKSANKHSAELNKLNNQGCFKDSLNRPRLLDWAMNVER